MNGIEEVKSFDDLEIIDFKHLGQGYIAKVKVARHKVTGKEYAVKIINKLKVSKGELEALRRELQIQKMLQHEHIVKMHTSFEKDGYLYIVLEYIKQGNLFEFLRKRNLSQEQVLSIFYQILTAIDYLHDKQILHRDIKPENVLMENENKIKLCDFGFCAFYGKNVVR